jgi:F-type H+-transporting ATPase subunit b
MMSFLPFLVLQVVIFIALVLVLRRVLSRNVTDAAAHLQGLSAEYSRRQAELTRRLEESERQYQEQVTRARTEAERMIAGARQEAESLRVKRLEEARVESERIVQQALESRDSFRKELERELETRAVQRACELIQETLPMELRRDIQSKWLEELFRDGLVQLDRLKTEGGVCEVQVVCALPLTKEQRDVLRARLREKLARDITLTERLDDRLVAGLTITIGSLVFDSSLSSKIRQAIRTREGA